MGSMPLSRRLILGIGNRPKFRRQITEGSGRRVARRFVAGETLDEALAVARTLNAAGFLVSLDALGESVTDATHASAATELYVETLRRIGAGGVRSEISVKPTQLGLDIDEDVCRRNLERIVAAAAEVGTTVTIDMEGRDTTERTLALACDLARAYPDRVGVALQAYLHRSRADLSRLLEARVRIRLCKGAYKEPRSAALRKREEISAAFASLATTLLEGPSYAMVATHDPTLTTLVEREAKARNLAGERFEFQMLYGVHRKLQKKLLANGHRVRIYVPFGAEWYPYLLRRIAERPSNLRFVLAALLRR